MEIMEWKIIMTWSKVMALVVIILAFTIDIYSKSNGTVFMFSIPFVVFLITGKQLIDRKK